jgi:hypothetical protein
MIRSLSRRFVQPFIADSSALAITEFAFALPILVLLGMGGGELANYITVKMRVSQLALQIADNAARMGEGSASGTETISESDINDVFTGSQLQSGSLNLAANGRVILTDLEVDPSHAGKFMIKWQRCYGAQVHPSQYGIASGLVGANNYNNLAGIGPTARQVTTQSGNATMFVEVYYVYRPLFSAKFAPGTMFDEIASMAVRDQRDLTQIYNAENATISSC